MGLGDSQSTQVPHGIVGAASLPSAPSGLPPPLGVPHLPVWNYAPLTQPLTTRASSARLVLGMLQACESQASVNQWWGVQFWQQVAAQESQLEAGVLATLYGFGYVGADTCSLLLAAELRVALESLAAMVPSGDGVGAALPTGELPTQAADPSKRSTTLPVSLRRAAPEHSQSGGGVRTRLDFSELHRQSLEQSGVDDVVGYGGADRLSARQRPGHPRTSCIFFVRATRWRSACAIYRPSCTRREL